jgi:hypothetical protein
MGSIQECRKTQNRAIVFWRVFLLLSLLAILSPAVADRLIQFEVTMALAFFGIVCAVTSMVMIGVFKHRRKLIESISETGSFLDAWEVQDRFGEHQGKVVPACFSREGVFYASVVCSNCVDKINSGMQARGHEGTTYRNTGDQR